MGTIFHPPHYWCVTCVRSQWAYGYCGIYHLTRIPMEAFLILLYECFSATAAWVCLFTLGHCLDLRTNSCQCFVAARGGSMICVRRRQVIKRAQLQGRTTEGTITRAERAEYINTGLACSSMGCVPHRQINHYNFWLYKNIQLLFSAIQAWTAEKLLNFRLAYWCYSVNHSLIRTRLQPSLKALLLMNSWVFVTGKIAQLSSLCTWVDKCFLYRDIWQFESMAVTYVNVYPKLSS